MHKSQQFSVHGLVAGENMAFGQHVVAAVEVADEAAGFAHHEEAGGDVPGREVALPMGIETAGRDPGEIERRRAEAATTFAC